MIINDRARAAFTPTGTLRASISLGNPILAGWCGADRAGDPPAGRAGAGTSREPTIW
jgi:hypothetical protein